jgi:WD40 repeat protein
MSLSILRLLEVVRLPSFPMRRSESNLTIRLYSMGILRQCSIPILIHSTTLLLHRVVKIVKYFNGVIQAMVWKIPSGGLTESISTPVVTLSGHGRKVGHVLFNPCADNILATTSTDFTVKIWDISTGKECYQLDGHAEIIQSLSWSYEGNMLITACKDKKIRLYDVRTGKVAQVFNISSRRLMVMLVLKVPE